MIVMKTRLWRTVRAAAFLAGMSACMAFGQEGPKVVEARMVLAANGVRTGSAAKAAVIGQVRSGFHINAHHPSLDYLIPTKLELEGTSKVSVARIVYPKGKLTKFPFSDTPLLVYEGEVPIGILLQVPKSISSKAVSLSGKLTYQACNDHACLPPTSVPLSLTLKVLPSGVPLRAENASVFSKIKFK
jgi:thioredoxin:protein disulfide reductase